MKKKFLSGIVAAVLGVLTLAPVAGYADVDPRADTNNDGVVNISDYTLLRRAIEYKGQIENGTVITFVRGDVNADGKLDRADLDLLKQYGNEGVVIDDKLADANNDGVVDLSDYTILRRAIEYKGELMSDGHVQPYVTGDLNGDGAIDKTDLELLKELV